MRRTVIALSLMLSILNAQDIDIDGLLGDIEKKTDLSSKTKLENGGISTIYTRDDLTRMQAKTLKDILKSTYPLGYTENNYGLPDPYFMGTKHPSVSSSIRIFLDDQELSTGLYGSGMVAYGNIELNFIDHIEVYTSNPTYEYSTEPTFVLVKLYSKNAQKDAGSKVSAQVGSFGDSLLSIYNSGELGKDWSYFAYASQNDAKREKHTSHDTELSRDSKITHMFASIYDDNNKILIDARKAKKDTFIAQSIDATPTQATMENDVLHIGYNGEYNNISYLLAYDILNTKTNMKDDVVPISTAPFYGVFPLALIETDAKSSVISGEVKYDYTTESNKLITGLKYRYKDYKFDTLRRNGIDIPQSENTNQTVATAFVENQYSLEKNSIITTGVSFSKVKNNNSIQNDDLLMYRLGHTYTTNDFVFKTIYSHVELTLDPYLINQYGVYIMPGEKEITEQDLLLENIIYEVENNKYELILSYLQSKNQLAPDINTGLLDNLSKTLDVKSIVVTWTHKYNRFDKLYISAEYDKMNNVPLFDSMKQYKGIVRGLNTYKQFDFFNEILYSKDSVINKNFIDYSAGVIYHASDDLSISLKATNILDKAETTTYSRVNPQTFQMEEPLNISAIDRHVMLTVEYLF